MSKFSKQKKKYRNMNYLCSLANTKEDFKRLITPNPDDWKWNNESKLKARKDIWGF